MPSLSEGAFADALQGNATLEVFNPIGQRVYSETIENKQEYLLLLDKLPIGSYILKISYKDQIISKRIVKK